MNLLSAPTAWARNVAPLAALAIVLLAGARAGAQDLDDEDEGVDPAVLQQQNRAVFELNESQFDQWVFGGGVTAASARTRVDSTLTIQLDELDRTCGLSAAQKNKLRLAAKGDVKRFFDKVELKRQEFQTKRYEQDKVSEIYQQLQPLQLEFNAGLFNENSFFAKAVRGTLEPAQASKYDAVTRERRAFRFRAKVDLVVSTVGSSLGLSADQREKFAKVLLENTKPPRNFGRYDYHVILLQASRVPDATLRPIFDDAQWAVLNRQIGQFKRLEPFLKTNGYVPDDEDEAAKPAEVKK